MLNKTISTNKEGTKQIWVTSSGFHGNRGESIAKLLKLVRHSLFSMSPKKMGDDHSNRSGSGWVISYQSVASTAGTQNYLGIIVTSP